MIFDVEAICDVGCVRTNNEDMVLVAGQFLRDSILTTRCVLEGPTARQVFAVADGMGGAAAGEVASERALRDLEAALAPMPDDLDPEELAEAMNRWAADTHQALLAEGATDPAKSGMGTTIVGLLIYNGAAYRFHVGDSRLYRYRASQMTCLTRDHSAREVHQVDFLPSNLLANSLGGCATSWLEFAPLEGGLAHGDRYLLSSDGLHDLVDDATIASLMAGDRSMVARTLQGIARGRGGRDNISILIADLQLPDGPLAGAH